MPSSFLCSIWPFTNCHHSSANNGGSNIVRQNPGPSAYLLYNNNMGMSKERRKFLIVNVFDFVLCTLLWLFSAVTKPYKTNWLDTFIKEVNVFEPDFLYNSLFDLAILAFFRMLILLFSYAWIKCDHWIPVAMTTTVSTLFIGIKIFFFFDKDKGTMQQSLVIIASLCLPWFELWLMPFRVLDREHQRDIAVETGSNVEHAATGRGMMTAQALIRQIITNEEEMFQTAMEADSSDDNDEDRCNKNVSRIGKISRRKCKEAIARAQNEADYLMSGVHSWKVLQKGGQTLPDIRYHDPTNSYYVKNEFNHSARAVFNAIWKESPKWNSQVLESRIIAVVDSTTDIVITVTKATGGGYIAPRHFIDIRRHIVDDDNTGNLFVGVYVSVDSAEDSGHQHPPRPPSKSTMTRGRGSAGGGPEVRGCNGVNMIRITQLADNRCLYEWIMNTDLRLTIPKILIRRTITSFFVDYTRMLAAFLLENPTGIK